MPRIPTATVFHEPALLFGTILEDHNICIIWKTIQSAVIPPLTVRDTDLLRFSYLAAAFAYDALSKEASKPALTLTIAICRVASRDGRRQAANNTKNSAGSGIASYNNSRTSRLAYGIPGRHCGSTGGQHDDESFVKLHGEMVESRGLSGRNRKWCRRL